MTLPSFSELAVGRTDTRSGSLDACLALLEDTLARGLDRLAEGAVAAGAIPLAEARALLGELAEERATSDGACDQTAVLAERLTPALEHAARTYALSELDVLALLLVLAVESDDRYGRVLSCLQGSSGGAPLTVGLALSLFSPNSAYRRRALAHFLPEAPLCQFALIALEGDGPLSGRRYHAADAVWPRLLAIDTQRCDFELVPMRPRALDELVLPSDVRHRVGAVGAWLRDGTDEPVLVTVSGPAGSGREALASALAAASGSGALVVDAARLTDPGVCAALRRDALWFGSRVVVRDLAGEHSAEAGRLATCEAAIVWVTTENQLETILQTSRRRVLDLPLAFPTPAQRVRLWQHFLPAERAADVDCESLASRFRFGPSRIRATVALAESSCQTAGGERHLPTQADLDRASRALPAGRLGALAHRLEHVFERDDLVVPAEVRRELDLVLAWSRHRLSVERVWSERQRHLAGRGLACLFSGPPGTGKTMAAQILSAELRLDAYRIDLSQVVNKYIGETEKNLATLFDEAAASNAILFFDEADALFSRRTDVKDAHDRFANIETGFLLQRLEEHEGIVILATNLRRNLDEAFLRRLQVIVDFPLPDPAERHAIWQGLMPATEHLDGDVDLDFLAQRFQVSGGQIRNAVVAAVYMAAARGEAVGMKHMAAGLWREIKKSGRIVSPETLGPYRDAIEGF